MSGWNEDNFLDMILALLKRRRAIDPCPETAAFYAMANNHVNASLKDALDAHVLGCRVCQDLRQRLQQFDGWQFAEEDADWAETEKRFDDWFKSSLPWNSADYRPGRSVTESHSRSWKRAASSLLFVRQVRWGFSITAIAALAICSFLAGRRSAPRTVPVAEEVAQHTPPAATAENRIPPVSAKQLPQLRALPSNSRRVVREENRDPTEVEQPQAQGAAASHNDGEMGQLAVVVPPNQIDPGSLAGSEKPDGMGGPATGPSHSERSLEIAGTRMASSGPANALALRPTITSRQTLDHKLEAKPESRLIPPPPSLFRLDAGTRVWIVLKSVSPRPGETSDFRGILLLPVTQSGAKLLSRNTAVIGNMVVRNGRTTIQILEFSSGSTRYGLKGAGSEVEMRLLGAGDVVQFDAGKVLETWMTAPSVYEKLPNDISKASE